MHTFSVRNFAHFVVVATFLHSCQDITAKKLRGDSSGPNTTGSEIWQPTEGTRSKWMACNGLPKDTCERTKIKYRQLQEAIVKAKGLKELDNLLEKKVADSKVNSLEGIWLTEEQIDMLMTEAKKSKDPTLTRRKKGTIMNLKNNAYSKWPLPIHFKFDGTHDKEQKTTIRNAFQHWMDNTCVRFSELATNAPFGDHHILMTSERRGCYSPVGRVSFKPQQINLPGGCLYRFGVPVHEIGHSLGLWNEQQRSDRDRAIRVVWTNVDQNFVSQLSIVDMDDYGVPYNYGSVMHYSSKDRISANENDTMIALDPLYQMNMGQRTGLSFEDIKVINLAYCQGSCKSPLSQSCQRGGYQNPNNCSTCICPDGFSGRFCDQVAPAKSASCGGVINIGSQNQQTIKSPGYDDKHYYISHQECNWWIKAPENYRLQLTFAGEFGLYSEYDACFHWVEIKFKRDLGLEGGRFCGNRRPNVTVTSQSNEMMIVFRSNYTSDYFPAQRGFQIIVKPINSVVGNNPMPTSSTTTANTKSSTTLKTTMFSKAAPVPVSTKSKRPL